jgi:hypothetical protein
MELVRIFAPDSKGSKSSAKKVKCIGREESITIMSCFSLGWGYKKGGMNGGCGSAGNYTAFFL